MLNATIKKQNNKKIFFSADAHMGVGDMNAKSKNMSFKLLQNTIMGKQHKKFSLVNEGNVL